MCAQQHAPHQSTFAPSTLYHINVRSTSICGHPCTCTCTCTCVRTPHTQSQYVPAKKGVLQNKQVNKNCQTVPQQHLFGSCCRLELDECGAGPIENDTVGGFLAQRRCQLVPRPGGAWTGVEERFADARDQNSSEGARCRCRCRRGSTGAISSSCGQPASHCTLSRSSVTPCRCVWRRCCQRGCWHVGVKITVNSWRLVCWYAESGGQRQLFGGIFCL
jgi:hypothetical protein